MKITCRPAPPQQRKPNRKRARAIIQVLVRYGLADGVSRLGLEFAKDLFKSPEGEILARATFETRARLALTELGPTFIKLGQILSTRPDLVGVEMARELTRLQADAPADPPEVVRAMIEAELGQPAEELFLEFDDEALASASIGQVHRARLKSGEPVVVKVQHPGIAEKMRVDLEILVGLAQVAELSPEFKNYRPAATAAEFQRTLLRELDFGREERNMTQFASAFRDDPSVHIPEAFPDLCTGRILTMEFLDGIKLSDADELLAAGIDLEEVARRGAELYLQMIFTHGFYHADPHPGNIVILRGNVVGLLDFGMVGRLDEQLREDIEEMLFAIGSGDARLLTSIITRMGEVPPDLDEAALGLEVNDYVGHYTSQSLETLDLSAALNELTEIIRRFHIMLPPRIAMLIKVLVMLEGTSRLLNPRFSLAEVMRPYQEKMVWRRLSPARHVKKLRRIYAEVEHLVEALPRGILDILQQVRSGKFDVHLEHRGLEPSVNRLVLGLLTSAMFLGSSLLLSYKVPPVLSLGSVLPQISIVGAVGVVVSVVMGLRLLWAIRKSGHLDRRK
jgi:ubiquinone biosynthesis protein